MSYILHYNTDLKGDKYLTYTYARSLSKILGHDHANINAADDMNCWYYPFPTSVIMNNKFVFILRLNRVPIRICLFCHLYNVVGRQVKTIIKQKCHCSPSSKNGIRLFI